MAFFTYSVLSLFCESVKSPISVLFDIPSEVMTLFEFAIPPPFADLNFPKRFFLHVSLDVASCMNLRSNVIWYGVNDAPSCWHQLVT